MRVPEVNANGSLAAASDVVALHCAGHGSIAVQLTGTWVGTVTFQGSLDNSTWVSLYGINVATSVSATTATANGVYGIDCAGLVYFRVNMTSYTSGTATVRIFAVMTAGSTLTTGPITVTADTEFPTAVALADAASAAPTTTTGGVIPLLMNATTVDRQRAVVNALDSVGTGIAAAGLVGQLDDTATGTVTENQFSTVRISSRRALLVEGVASGTNLNVNLAASSATVTVDTELPAAAALADATANPTTSIEASAQEVFNGTTWDRMRAVANAQDSTGTGIAAAGLLGQFDDTATSAVTENQFAPVRISTRRNLKIEGDLASGSAIVANPLTVGGRAATTNPTAVTDGQTVNQMFDKMGKAVVVTGAPRALKAKSARLSLTTTTETSLIAAGGASVFNDITSVVVTNTSATGTFVDFRDVTAGSVIFTIYVPATDTRGISGTFFPQATANSAWTAQANAGVSTLYITATYEINL